tara:strand:- start:2786 stop:3877 length:1092 start_codon:yes stop_codon:yes gene_type:complete
MSNKKTHISFLIGQLGTGGYEKQMTLLISKLNHAEYRISVFVWGNDEGFFRDELKSIGCEIISLEYLSIFEKLKFIRIKLSENDSAIIHNYSFFLNFITWLVSIGTSAEPIGAVRSNIKHEAKEMFWLMGKLNVFFPSVLIFNNYAAKNYAEESIFLPSKRSSLVIQNGIDLSLFPRAKYKSNDEIKLVSIGSLTPVKRHDWIINLGKRLKKDNIKFKIDVIGDGPLFKSYKNQINHAKLESLIMLHGNKKSIVRYLLDADIFIHTSEVEGFPNSIMEAMAVGLPVVTTKVGDVNFLIEDGNEGFAVPLDDFDEFYERLNYLIKNEAQRLRMGAAARNKIRKNYSDQLLVNKTTDLYKELVRA